jgi:nucleoside-diphosphate-sugar epimerase
MFFGHQHAGKAHLGHFGPDGLVKAGGVGSVAQLAMLRHGGFDITRTRAVLGYAPRVTLNEGLAEIGRRYRAGLGA